MASSQPEVQEGSYHQKGGSADGEYGPGRMGLEFSAVSDRIGDPGEKVSFKLETLPPGTTAGTLIETVVTIEDVAPQGSTTVSFGADTYGVSEGSFTTITVVMSHAPLKKCRTRRCLRSRPGLLPDQRSSR